MTANRTHYKKFQEVGSWVLDTIWTELLVRGNREQPGIQYRPVPNAVYAKMKGHRDQEPLWGAADESVGNLWEAYGSLLFLRDAVPDWRGIRSIMCRAMIAQVEIDGIFPGQASTWADRARAWRSAKKEDEFSEDEDVCEASGFADGPNQEGSTVADPVMVDSYTDETFEEKLMMAPEAEEEFGEPLEETFKGQDRDDRDTQEVLERLEEERRKSYEFQRKDGNSLAR